MKMNISGKPFYVDKVLQRGYPIRCRKIFKACYFHKKPLRKGYVFPSPQMDHFVQAGVFPCFSVATTTSKTELYCTKEFGLTQNIQKFTPNHFHGCFPQQRPCTK